MKRITSSLLALLLALSMLIGMVPAAYAAPADTIESIDSTKTVDSSETEDVLDEAEEVAAQATEGTAVAEVNGNTYPDLKTAISAMSTGATLKLLDDVNLGTSAIGFYKSGTENLTFDLNGHTITSSYDEKGTVTATRNGLLIMNGTIVNNSTSSTKTTSAVYVSNGGTTTLRNVKLISNMSGLAVCDLDGNSKSKSATVTIEDDTTVGDNVQYGVYLSSLKATAQKERAVTLNINGGTITGTKNGVYVYGPGSSKYGTVKASITGGTVSDVMVSTGDGPKTPVDIAISGGTITGALTSLGTNEVAISGGTIIGDLKQNGKNATISITGGTIGGALNNTNGTITVTGGTFTTADPSNYLADGYEFVNGQVTSGSSTTGAAKIGDTGYETLDAAFKAANDNDEIIINAGTYEMSDLSKLSNRTVTVSAAAGATVVFDNAGAIGMGSASVTFKGITFDYMPNRNYTGLQHSSNMVYENCVFNGMVFLYGTSETFNTCKFNQTEEGAYNVWTYTGENVSFNNCEFTCYGRCVYIYNEGGLGEKVQTVSFVNSTFEAKKTVSGKAAIEISTELMGASATVAVDDKTAATGFATDTNSGSSLWNVKKTKEDTTAGGEKNATITVAGTQVFGPASNVASIDGNGYETLAAAIAAAKDGDTVTLLSDIELTSAQKISKKLTLDLNGKTLDSTAYRTIQLNSGADLTVQDSVGTGKIANSYNRGTYPSTVYLNAKDTVFTLVSGTIESDPYKTSLQSVAINSEKDKACTVNIQGGSVVVPAAAKEGRAIVASTNSMTLNISDGKIAGGLHGIDAYSGSTVNITGGKVTATHVDTGVIKEAYGMRIIGTANVTINGGEIQGIKMDDDGYNLDVPNVTLVSGKVNGSFYSISTGTIVFTVEPTATITFENDTVKNFLPSTVELVRNEDGTYGVTKKVTYVAEVNGKQYTSLQAAFDVAVTGNTITLLDDLTEIDAANAHIVYNLTGKTLDLNGKTYTHNNFAHVFEGTGGTIKNGKMVCATGVSYALFIGDNDETTNFTVDGVELTGGINIFNATGVVLKNLTVNGTNYYAVWLDEGAAATIESGTYNAGDVAAFNAAKGSALAITGGTVNTNGKTLMGTSGGTLSVSGGTFDRAVLPEYCADGFIPTQNEDGTYGVKEGSYVAETGGVYYDSLQAAIDAAGSGKTVTLLSNTRENVTINKDITLDLGGKTLTNAGEHTIVNNGTLTIKDSSTAQTGTVDNVTHGCGALVNNGTVILSGGTFERSAEKGTFEPYGNGGNSWYTIANYGTMTIDNGTTVKNAGGYSSNIRNGGQDSTAKLTINGGTFDGGVNTVKNDANGVLEIKGGELKNTAQYVIMNWNQATISGGTFETAETAGAVLFSSAYGNDGTACGELTITGGTFKAAGSKLIDDAYDANNHGTVKISGGSFNRAVDPKHCDTGFIPTQNADGTYGVKAGTYVAEVNGTKYESLQAAINAARRNGTVKLLADTRENVTISTPYLTLDLNGHTLNGGTEKGKPALTVTARVTVKDSSEAQTGTIMREDTADNSGVSSHYVIDVQGGGWLTFESGNVKNGSGVVGVKGASLVRVGDDSVAKYPGLNIKGGTFTQDNFIVIKVDRGDLFLNGGTLNSANSYAIEDWHRATIKGGTVNGAVAAWTYSGGLNSDLTISGGTINGDVTSVNYGNAEGKTAKVSITGGTINGKLDTRSYDPATNELTSIDDAAKATIEVTGGTFKNDPTKYVVENSKVTNNADGTFGVEKAYLAKVGETSYYTMDEAFKAQTASGKPIVLLRDYTTGSPFNSGTINRTVDLNGHTWTCTGTDANSAAFEINNPNVTLTVKNGKIVSSQLVGLIPSAMGGTIKYDNSGLVFEGVEMSTTATSGIETNGSNTNDSVTLKNSTLNVPNGFGIYFPSSGKLTIENSTINAKTMGVQVCAGSLSINEGSAITVSDGPVDKTENDGAIQDGAAISIVNRTGYKGLDTITVTGGTFTAKTGNAAIKAYDWANNTATDFTEPTKVEVSGGTFSAEVPADLCAPGYVPQDNGDGTYGVAKAPAVAKIGETEFTSLKDAIATAEAGATIEIIRDINTPAVSYEIAKNLTINLNSHKITADGYDAVFQISGENANVVLNGPGEVVAVENTGSAGKYAMAVWACGAGCTVTINGEVKFSQTIEHEDCKQYDMIYSSKGTIIINGGHYESFTPAWTLNCKDAAYKDGTAKIIVNGGTFVGCDPRNNTAEGAGTNFVAEGVGVDYNANGSFTAKPNMVAQIVDADGSSVAAYATLKEAVDAAKNGETVTLLADVDLDAQIATGKAITINGQGKYTIKATKKLVGTSNKAGMFYRTTSAQGTLTFLNVTLDGNGVSKIFLNEGGAGETVFDGVTSINGGGISYGSGIHISGGGSHATIKNSTLTGSKGTTELSEANYFAANDLWVGGNVYVTVENSTIGYVFVNSAPSATATNNVVHGQLTITGANTRITYLSGEEEAADKLDKFGNNGSLVKIDSGNVETIFDKGSYEISGGTFKTEVKPEWCADGYVPVDNGDGTYTVDEISTEASYIDADGKLQLGLLKDLLYLSGSKGKKLTIYKDIEIDYVVLLNDRELNLNGHTLTVNDTFVAVTGSVKDTEDGKGLIKIDAKNLHLAPNNGNVGQIPIFDSAKGGYRLFNFTMTGRTIGKGNGVEVDLRPEFTNPEAYELMKAGSTNNITFTVTISWMSENGPASQEFIFVQRLVDNVADKNGNGFFFIILNGLDSDMVGSIKDIKAQGSIKSGTGVSVNSVYYDIPQN